MSKDLGEHKFESEKYAFATKAIHTGQEPEKWDSRCVVPPIVLSTTFKQHGPGEYMYDYGRSGNPSRQVLEECLASLESTKYGLCFASGLAATTTVSYLLQSGDHVLLCDDVYGGTNRFFRHCASRMGIDSTFVDMLDLKNISTALKPNTKMVWIETPTNPTLKIIDIQAVSDLVRKTHPNAIILVDNTFSSAFFQTPINLGADIVLHSLTKYMNGHSDVVMGALMLNNEELYKKLKFFQNSIGAVPSPFDCFLVNRGVKTLPVRMKTHQENGIKIAKWLETNPRVVKVLYPGLPSHPQYDLFKRQMKGFGGMISLYIKGGLNEASTFLKSLKLFALAESLGGYESLIEHPALMTHGSVPKEQREILGIGDNFIRLSVGLEDADDLIADLEQALLKAVREQTVIKVKSKQK